MSNPQGRPPGSIGAGGRRIALVYALGGVAILGGLLVTQPFPPIALLVSFAIATVIFEWRAVEVNDRLLVSGGAMVVLTAGVAFGPESAVLGMALLVAAGTFQRIDLIERRWFQPAVNFGQDIVSASLAGVVLITILPTELSASAADLGQTVLASLLAGLVYAAVSVIQVSLIVRVAFGKSDVRPWSGMTSIITAFLAMGTLGGLLGATFKLIGNESFPLLVALFIIFHMGFASYADLREAHEATIRGFIKALEAKDMLTHGHTERVAKFVRLIGEELGWSADRLEVIRRAALVHDVGTLAVPRDLLRNRDSLNDAEAAQVLDNTETVEAVLAESDFLKPMMERAARRRMLFSEAPSDEITEDAQVLAVAKQFDFVTSGKAHHQAVSQDEAFANLRAESPYRYDPEIVAALDLALRKAGQQFGSVELKRRLTREDIAKQAMYDR